MGPDTFEHSWRQQASGVRKLVREFLGDAASADEVVQQTWLTALRRPPAPTWKLGAWLARVARNHARAAAGPRARAPADRAYPRGRSRWPAPSRCGRGDRVARIQGHGSQLGHGHHARVGWHLRAPSSRDLRLRWGRQVVEDHRSARVPPAGARAVRARSHGSSRARRRAQASAHGPRPRPRRR
ncbi:MAG: sigma-70 family RNA polymerase sigma factor [Planctomycetes bacterium]|nr:sigma-70 family RNA polymerase sigma factor [Planctomycetota bacterium]